MSPVLKMQKNYKAKLPLKGCVWQKFLQLTTLFLEILELNSFSKESLVEKKTHSLFLQF